MELAKKDSKQQGLRETSRKILLTCMSGVYYTAAVEINKCYLSNKCWNTKGLKAMKTVKEQLYYYYLSVHNLEPVAS
jgi:hypothetical protein